MSKKEHSLIWKSIRKLRSSKFATLKRPRASKISRGRKFKGRKCHKENQSIKCEEEETKPPTAAPTGEGEGGEECLSKVIISGDFEAAFNILLSPSWSPSMIQETFTKLRLTHLHLLAFSTSPFFPTKILEALIHAGCDANATDAESRTLLHLLILYERYDDLERCIDLLKGSIEAENDEGRRPLHEAALRGSKRAVEALLKAGAAVNPRSRKSGLTPLQYAVLQEAQDVVERMLEEDEVDVNATAVDYFTALDLAKENKSEVLQKMLISKGAVSNINEDEDEDDEEEYDDEEEEDEDKEQQTTTEEVVRGKEKQNMKENYVESDWKHRHAPTFVEKEYTAC